MVCISLDAKAHVTTMKLLTVDCCFSSEGRNGSKLCCEQNPQKSCSWPANLPSALPSTNPTLQRDHRVTIHLFLLVVHKEQQIFSGILVQYYWEAQPWDESTSALLRYYFHDSENSCHFVTFQDTVFQSNQSKLLRTLFYQWSFFFLEICLSIKRVPTQV